MILDTTGLACVYSTNLWQNASVWRYLTNCRIDSSHEKTPVSCCRAPPVKKYNTPETTWHSYTGKYTFIKECFNWVFRGELFFRRYWIKSYEVFHYQYPYKQHGDFNATCTIESENWSAVFIQLRQTNVGATDMIIKSAFRSSSLQPLQRKNLLTKLSLVYRISSPIRLPDQSSLQTPRNATEINHPTTLIKYNPLHS